MGKRIVFITFEEFRKLYSAEKDKEMKLALLLGFGSGLRISEILGFKRKNEQPSISPLTKQMVFLSQHQIRLEDAKGGKWRTTITSPILTQDMINLLPLKIPRRTLQYRFEQLSTRILKKKMSFHTLRHGFGNYQANVLKVPISIVQQLMGHSRLDTTGIYTKANPEQAIAESWKAMMKEK